ncbi:MAG: GAF domain-containing protein [Chloroflexi bacterium]|nr:GAF domain-containing protein [Chloroflexota bacterium]
MLIPASTRIADIGLPGWVLLIPGTACFIFALILQTITLLPVPLRQARYSQILAAILLIVIARVFQAYGFIAEAWVFLIAGVIQILLALPLARQLENIDLLDLAFALIGFLVGIHLAIAKSGAAHTFVLAVGFFVSAFLGASTIVLPSFKYNFILRRLQIIPWLAWSILCVPSADGANLVTPTAAILILLSKDFLPWSQTRVPEGDILGRRVIMIGATIELTLLIFLSTLLLAFEQSMNVVPDVFISPREAAFFFFIILVVVINYEIITVLMTINGLMQELSSAEEAENAARQEEPESASIWTSRLARYLKPYMSTREGTRIRINAQADQIQVLSRQVTNEKKRNAQLTLLLELSQQLENQLDQPVAAQLAVNTLERALNCSLVTIYIHEPERKEFMLLSSAGRQINLVPAGYRQSSSKGAIGRAYRQRKTQIINDIRADADYILFENETNLSALLIPLIHNGHVNGVIVLNSESANAFSSIDIGLAEAVAAELTRAWERSGYHQRLMDLIQAGSQLSSVVDPSSTAQDVAALTREILQAKFTYVHIQLGQERNFIQSASSGNASRLLASLEASIENEDIIQVAFQASQPFRVRDVRKYSATSSTGD